MSTLKDRAAVAAADDTMKTVNERALTRMALKNERRVLQGEFVGDAASEFAQALGSGWLAALVRNAPLIILWCLTVMACKVIFSA